MERFTRDASDVSFTNYIIMLAVLIILFWYFNIKGESRCIIIAEEQFTYI
jgi:hypothetical protein